MYCHMTGSLYQVRRWMMLLVLYPWLTQYDDMFILIFVSLDVHTVSYLYEHFRLRIRTRKMPWESTEHS